MAAKKWVVAPHTPQPKADAQPGMNPVVFHLLASRGIAPQAMSDFLAPDYAEHVHDPFLFSPMRTAVDVIVKHIRAGNAITVYGDYDADGVTSTAVMVETLRFVTKQLASASVVDVYIPDRITEGYGMNAAAMEAIAAAGTQLVITVDTGIRNAEVVAHAQSAGLEVVITDHHEPPVDGSLPPCTIINPKVDGQNYPFTELAGCGVAFKVAQALARTVAQAGGDAFVCESFEKWLLDLVAIGTVADLMPLVDENRVLVTYGLVVLNKTKRRGLQKLMELSQSNIDRSGQPRTVDAWQIGFQLAPRLNAAGRLGHANSAYELLMAEDAVTASRLARELDATNRERQAVTQEIFAYVDKQSRSHDDMLLGALWPGLHDGEAGEPWPAGVMGLVAGKLTEAHYKPAVAITAKHNGDGKQEIVGSGRSIPEFNITAMLEECKEHLSHYGGHKQACGFTIKEGQLEVFMQQARAIAERELHDAALVPILPVDMEIALRDVNEELYQALEKMKPYGAGNIQPKFVSRRLPVVDIRSMGSDGQHLKVKVQAENKIPYDCIAFNVADEWKALVVGDSIDIVYYVDINEWNGRRELQLKVIDLKKSE